MHFRLEIKEMADKQATLIPEHSPELIRKFSGPFGTGPATFSTTIRFLMNDYEAGSSELSKQSDTQLKRLLNSSTMLATIYSAIKYFHPERLAGKSNLQRIELAKLLDPLTLAAVLSILYLYRRAKHISASDEWQYVSEGIRTDVFLGAAIGASLPEIGCGIGIISGAGFTLAWAPFSAFDKKSFKEYRRALKSKSLDYNPAFELQKWGCTCLEVCGSLLVGMGMGSRVPQALVLCGVAKPDLKDEKVKALITRIRAVRLWIQSIKSKGKSAQYRKDDPFCRDEETFKKIVAQSVAILDNPGNFDFLEKTKGDASPHSMPEIDFGQEEEPGRAETEQGLSYEDLPEHVREVIGEEEFRELRDTSLGEIVRMAEEELEARSASAGPEEES
ncbi:MAG: hypothetical protein DCC75_06005 [Proteobacteria bacterium]|nr:MAG: hypothetical protein DCC75_06005 [Pseudomonadota bacterium]